MRRAIITLAVIYAILMGIGMGVGAYVHHKRQMVTFSVNIPSGSTVKVYADQGGDAPFQYDPKKPLFTLASDQKIETKVGVYDFVLDHEDDYQTNVKKVTVNKATTRVDVNPDFSTAKLQAELVKNKDQIIAAVNAKFPKTPTYYTVGKVDVYKSADWAGLTLVPKSPQYDPVRLVLNKKGGVWTVINSPTIFVLGSLYKNVPPDVVAAINSL